MKHDELLRLSGVLSDAARAVTGGKSITIGTVPAATVINISQRVDELREAVDAYDAEIIRLTETSTWPPSRSPAPTRRPSASPERWSCTPKRCRLE